MPNIKSAAKRLKTSEKAHQRNRAVKTTVATSRKKLLTAIAGGDRAQSETAFRAYCSVLDKAVKQGSVSKNNAARRKSRIAAKLAVL